VRVAFFGLPLGALMLARDGHDVAWAAICRRRALGTRRLAARLGRSRLHIEPDARSDETFAALRAARPDLVVSWFWTKKLPARVLDLAPAFGVHPSLLPRHRGADPFFWAIDGGDELTGVTAHVLEEDYDTGAVLGQRALHIDGSWNAWQLARALDRPSLGLLCEVARAYAQGRPPTPRPQDERSATSAPEPTDAELAVRWSWPAERIARRVRAAAPWPGAWTEMGDRIVTLVRVRPTADFPRVLLPGEAAVRRDGVAVVRAGDDAVELILGRDEDDAPLAATELSLLVRELGAPS
jgi:methionyl-tRNA formyltransferase